jgi:hypothetical protein
MALEPYLRLTNSKIARNHMVSGFREPWSIVPAVSDV